MRRTLFAAVILAVVAGSSFFPSARADAAPAVQAGDYIVVLKDGRDPVAAAAKYGVNPSAIYTAALSGYAGSLSAAQLKKITADSGTSYVSPDKTWVVGDKPVVVDTPPQPDQFVTSGVRRIGGLLSPTAKIDGIDERVDIDVAILDGGIDPTHPDLNVVGGVDCSAGQGHADSNGHGTMVAGFVGALDNAIGRVGVAPGARLWAVRVLNENGFGSDSRIVCGIDWVTRHADVIDVANMSLGGFEKRIDPCQVKNQNALHTAICKSVGAGVTYVVAAGNDTADAGSYSPAAYPEVITVSAMADSDGAPGGLGESLACLPEEDDTFAFFSNYGSVVDLSAPGVCISSTFPGGRYGLGSGTSYSSPLVAGAAALYLATHPDATPAQVRAALIADREQIAFADDPDGIAEGVVNVAGY